ncbi:MAG: hypothetical protein ACK5GU_04095 [Chloroflexota bacterium]|jgi:hypothetical protein
MSNSAHQIDVATLLADLQHRIQTNTNASGQASELTKAELTALHEALHELELTRVISSHWPIEGHGIVGRMVAVMQKVTRRLLRWYINPIVEQQNAYNDAVLRALRLLVDAYQEQSQSQAQLPPSAPTSTQEVPPITDTTIASQIQQQIATNEAPFSLWEHELRTDEDARWQIARIHAHWPLPVRKPIDYAANAIHKVQRLLLRWYINPIVERMNQSNQAMHRSLVQMSTYVIAMRVSLVIDQIRRRHE